MISSSENLTLLTDLYEITMAQGYWAMGKEEAQGCFYVHFRNYPFQGGYAVACGMAQIAEFLDEFSFAQEDIEYLAGLDAPLGGKLFDPTFLDYLLKLELKVDVDAVLDGTIVFPYEPLLRVTGPLIQCQLLETALLNFINFETLIATKAARICQVAEGPVAEFGLRRAQGPNGGLLAARAAIVGGCASTSNVLAGKLFGVPVSGTHAHSWIMSFDSEVEAFRAYAQASPKNCVLVVDTFDALEGVANAIIVGHEMEARGERLSGIRLDSGDLAWLSAQARKMLDEAGLSYVKIAASNDLDEFTIDSLKSQGAPIDSWGVGTRMVTAYDQPALGGVYKLCAMRDNDQVPWEPRLKISEMAAKLTLPGLLGLRRYVDEKGMLSGDMVYDISESPAEDLIIDPKDNLRRKNLSSATSFELLQPLARQGKSVLSAEERDVFAAQKRVKEGLATLDSSNKRLLNPHTYPVGLSRELRNKRDELVLHLKGYE